MASTARWGLKHLINGVIPPERASGMASTARWGLKHTSHHLCQARSPLRNGLYSPLGIETEDILYKTIPVALSGMASKARWGLKHVDSLIDSDDVRCSGMASTARWGLKPFLYQPCC